ncbi:hypothetical protein LVJ85_12225 [Neisseria sp. Dent CA1/247]|uniref:hypothetical protein n=1 Tax=Neisseria sp. Dent CA1/247 TaxID=2912675 RepID=UPI001FD1C68D|nr:hypothetical protein [Neisseria sp. Dent CA1/247]UOO76750.1 hypothetical protein LVJ85_12225 [Neisseria sp. Dent CA1/247]
MFIEPKESDFFLITEKELIEFSAKFPNKPLAFSFYYYVFKEKSITFDIRKIQNFWNKCDFETGALEIRFSDGSIFLSINGTFYISHEKSNYFATFNNS